MTFEQFISQTDIGEYYKKTPEERLLFAQEYENMMAAMEGREPCEVIVMPDDYAKEHPGLRGYHVRGQIAVRPDYLTSNKPKITGVSEYGFSAMLEVLTHEGRHAWQHHVVDHPEEDIVSRQLRLAIQMNCGPGYTNGEPKGNKPDDYRRSFTEYTAQLIEVDARHFAMDWIKYIAECFEKHDRMCARELSCEYSKLFNAEAAYAQYIVKYFDVKKMKEFEEAIKREMFPGIDMSNVSIFEDAMNLVDSLDTLAFIESRPIKVLLHIDDGKIDDTQVKGKTDNTRIQPHIIIKRKRPF